MRMFPSMKKLVKMPSYYVGNYEGNYEGNWWSGADREPSTSLFICAQRGPKCVRTH